MSPWHRRNRWGPRSTDASQRPRDPRGSPARPRRHEPAEPIVGTLESDSNAPARGGRLLAGLPVTAASITTARVTAWKGTGGATAGHAGRTSQERTEAPARGLGDVDVLAREVEGAPGVAPLRHRRPERVRRAADSLSGLPRNVSCTLQAQSDTHTSYTVGYQRRPRPIGRCGAGAVSAVAAVLSAGRGPRRGCRSAGRQSGVGADRAGDGVVIGSGCRSCWGR